MPQNIYVYDSDAEDFSTIGVCGPLIPAKATYRLERGKFGELEITHPKDEPVHGISKWKFLGPGRIIKASVPVRTRPNLIRYSDWQVGDPLVEGVYYRGMQTSPTDTWTSKKPLTLGTSYVVFLDEQTYYLQCIKAAASNAVTWLVKHDGDDIKVNTTYVKMTDGLGAIRIEQVEYDEPLTKGKWYKYGDTEAECRWFKCIKARARTKSSDKTVLELIDDLKSKKYIDNVVSVSPTQKQLSDRRYVTWDRYMSVGKVSKGLWYKIVRNEPGSEADDASPTRNIYQCIKAAEAGVINLDSYGLYLTSTTSGYVAGVVKEYYFKAIQSATDTKMVAHNPTPFKYLQEQGYIEQTDDAFGAIIWISGMSVKKGEYYTDGTIYKECLANGKPTKFDDSKQKPTGTDKDTQFFKTVAADAFRKTKWVCMTKPALSKDDRTSFKKKNLKSKASNKIKSDTSYEVTDIDRNYSSIYVSKELDKDGKATKTKCSGWYRYDSFIWDENYPRVVAIDESEKDKWVDDDTEVMIKPQLFRIYDSNITDGDGGSVTVKARAIAYDLMGNITSYASPTSGELRVRCAAAAKGILAQSTEDHDFTMYCNVADERINLDCRDMNIVNAILDESSGIAGKWPKVEIFTDDFDIYIMHQSSVDRGLRISYAYNLTGITCEEDMTDVITAIRPVGQTTEGGKLYLDGVKVPNNPDCEYAYFKNKDGSYKGSDGNKYKYKLPEGYKFYETASGKLDGKIIVPKNPKTNLDYPKIVAIDVSDAKVEKDKTEKSVVMQRLVNAAIDKFAIEKVDEVILKLTVQFKLLGETEEYKQYRQLERLFLYDTVIITHRPLGIEASTNCVGIEFDLLSGDNGTYTSATFGKIKNQTITVASWQISSINGQKIQNGSVSAGAIESISSDKINDLISTMVSSAKKASSVLNYISMDESLSKAKVEVQVLESWT